MDNTNKQVCTNNTIPMLSSLLITLIIQHVYKIRYDYFVFIDLKSIRENHLRLRAWSDWADHHSVSVWAAAETQPLTNLCVFHLLVLYYLSVSLDASSPPRVKHVSWHQLLHHLPLLLLFDKVLGNAPSPILPSGQILNTRTDWKYLNSKWNEPKQLGPAVLRDWIHCWGLPKLITVSCLTQLWALAWRLWNQLIQLTRNINYAEETKYPLEVKT